MKKIIITILVLLSAVYICGCTEEKEKTEITVLAAASLTDACGELKEAFEEENENINLIFSFGSSGALQAQIEEGAPADIFISAAVKQMDDLRAQGLIEEESVENLLENKVVLIAPKGNPAKITSFDQVTKADVIGMGEPSSVPAGQYAREIFTSLGLWDQVREKANYGSDVRTVLSWTENGAVDCGIVYATDAYTGENIDIICEAPENTHKPVIYPAGIIKSSENTEEAKSFMEFLKSSKAGEIFEKYGFTVL